MNAHQPIASIFSVLLIALVSCFTFTTCKKKQEKVEPLFTNSIVSTEIDFITAADPSVFTSLQFIEQGQREMPDKRNEDLFDDNTYVFKASFSDGNTVEIWAHSDFGSQAEAETYAQLVTAPLGKLPELMRKEVDHVVIHQGDETAFGESDGHFFVLYSENMETRISNNDLEETVFHESVHASYESTYINNKAWTDAQEKDINFITDYAANNPNKEDMAETAIFAYTMIKHPGRLSSTTEDWVKDNIPNRFDFFKTVY